MRFHKKLAALIFPLGVSCYYEPLLSFASVHKPTNSSNNLPIYKNPTYCVDDRVEDLVKRMTIEKKAGQLFQTIIFQGPRGTFDKGGEGRNSTENIIAEKLITYFNIANEIINAKETAQFVNLVQQRALNTRLGIPVTISSDPRHSFTDNFGTGVRAGAFFQWPESLGFAALRDPHLVKQFAQIAREEYRAVGIRAALHPQINVATEPKWARQGNTWGENATLTAELFVEYIKGF